MCRSKGLALPGSCREATCWCAQMRFGEQVSMIVQLTKFRWFETCYSICMFKSWYLLQSCSRRRRTAINSMYDGCHILPSSHA